MSNLILVALGGAIGASLRYLSFAQAVLWFGPAFPFGTLFVNVFGSFIMGIMAVVLTRGGVTSPMAPLIMTGVLGGFTTFSAFSLDTLKLYESGQVVVALGYVITSVLVSILALFTGLILARAIMA